MSGLISLFRPPMMPARQEGVSPSAITSISPVRVWLVVEGGDGLAVFRPGAR